MSTSCENFIRDLGDELWQLADTTALDAGDDFNQGRLMAFYEALSLLEQQTIAFGINLDAVGLGGRDPDSLVRKRAP